MTEDIARPSAPFTEEVTNIRYSNTRLILGFFALVACAVKLITGASNGDRLAAGASLLLGVVFILAGIRSRKAKTLSVTEEGIRLTRGKEVMVDLAWSDVERIESRLDTGSRRSPHIVLHGRDGREQSLAGEWIGRDALKPLFRRIAAFVRERGMPITIDDRADRIHGL